MASQVSEKPMRRGFDPSRREVVKALGAGLLIAVGAAPAMGQVAGGGRRGGGGFRGGGRPVAIGARVHIGQDGAITVMVGKVECGQGARAELTQAAAEELRVAADRVTLIMADTGLVPDDGMTAGSGTTPRTVPSVRAGAAAAREVLIALAARQWGVPEAECEARDGKVVHTPSRKELTYGQIAADEAAAKAFAENPPANVTVTPVAQWKVMGIATARPNGRELVTGGHHYPSDVVRPNMLFGKVLRAPAYGAKLASIDLAPAKAMKDVVAVQDGSFVGVAAATSWVAEQALEAIAKTAKWEGGSTASSATLYDDLRKNAQVPKNPFADELAKAAKRFKQEYHVAYIQHAPLEPRAAVAEWDSEGKLTVWTGTQNPFGVRGELERAFRLSGGAARVVVPDFGGGFGGKHSGECAVEAARLARGAKRPVSLRWTREEEFTWAYFRPAGVIGVEAGLDDKGTITSWHFININSGPSAVQTPYRIAKHQSKAIGSANPPLRAGSYRGLASTANVFARECAMDELAALAGVDPLEFRRNHLAEDDRLRAVLEAAAKKFDWAERAKNKAPGVGVGLACGTEKGSYMAACAEVAVDKGSIAVRRVAAAFECGKIVNPSNLMSQVQGAIMMGIGPALREQIRFEGGRVANAAFSAYAVPRFADVPATIDVELVDRPDLASTGAGETPIVGIAPAIANAVFAATGTRVREMPMKV